jgi:hypothetical protein
MKVQETQAAAEAAQQIRSSEDAQSLVENENQDHDYSENAQAGHIQADAVNQGEHQPREVIVKSSGGRHITQNQKSDGQKQKANVDREASVLANREESAKSFESKRHSVAPNHKHK